VALAHHWDPLSPALFIGVAVLAAYELGRRRLGPGRQDVAGQVWSFRSAVVLGVLTAVSPLGFWAGRSLTFLTVQGMLLTFVVAPMVVLAAPWTALAAARSPGHAAAAVEVLRRSRLWRVAGSPPAVVVAFLVSFWGWQVPPVLDAAARHPALHALQLVCYLVTSMALWGQLVGSRPFSPRLDYLGRTLLVVVALIGCWLPAAALVFEPRSWYPAFRHLADAPLGPMADQGLAGGTDWVLSVTALGAAAFWSLTAWLNHEEDDDWRLARLIEQTRTKMGVQPSWLEGPGE
jgi:putative membrane protein